MTPHPSGKKDKPMRIRTLTKRPCPYDPNSNNNSCNTCLDCRTNNLWYPSYVDAPETGHTDQPIATWVYDMYLYQRCFPCTLKRAKLYYSNLNEKLSATYYLANIAYFRDNAKECIHR